MDVVVYNPNHHLENDSTEPMDVDQEGHVCGNYCFSNTFITCPYMRARLCEGQTFIWRSFEWMRLDYYAYRMDLEEEPGYHKHYFTEEDIDQLTHYMDIDQVALDNTLDLLIETYLSGSFSNFNLGNERIIAIDSSFLIHINTKQFMNTTMIYQFDRQGQFIENMPSNIFLETYIPIIESNYKKINSNYSIYSNIDFTNIDNYLEYSDAPAGPEVAMKLRVSKRLAARVLYDIENKFFETNDLSQDRIRNTLNDQAIVDLVDEVSKKIPTSIPIIATADKGMITYANTKKVKWIFYNVSSGKMITNCKSAYGIKYRHNWNPN